MANLKDIQRRIGSVKNTQQITRAMKLVAAAKLRKAQEAVTSARPYSEKLMEVMESLASRVDPEAHPLLKRREVKRVLVLMMTGDRGLCGPFNNNIFKAALKVIGKHGTDEVSLAIVGGKGVDFFGGRPYPILEKFMDYGKKDPVQLAKQVAQLVSGMFDEEKADQIYMIYNKFRNVVSQEVQSVSLLPVSLPQVDEEAEKPIDYKYEPSAADALEAVLTLYVENQIYRALLESAASENGARMTAMDSATKNAKEMIENLTLQYNRARQAAITTELIEVVTGADALEG